jgi:hypothetical protein
MCFFFCFYDFYFFVHLKSNFKTKIYGCPRNVTRMINDAPVAVPSAAPPVITGAHDAGISSSRTGTGHPGGLTGRAMARTGGWVLLDDDSFVLVGEMDVFFFFCYFSDRLTRF